MPKLSIDYSKCCMYKIEHIEDETLVYVGQTTSFKHRKSKHKSDCNNENGNKFNCKLYKMILENGGWDMFQMIEIEKFPCNDRQEAERREYEIVRELKASMNTHFFLSNEEKELKQKRYQEYRLNKQLYNECMRELDFMT